MGDSVKWPPLSVTPFPMWWFAPELRSRSARLGRAPFGVVIAEAPITRPVSHPYSDEPEGGIESLCYPFDELFAEKLRALGERTRARDLYDVVHLFRDREYDPEPVQIHAILARKCEFKRIPVITLAIVEAAKDSVVGTWEGMLRHQLPELPPFDSFWAELPAVFAWLEAVARRPVLNRVSIEATEELLRPRVGGLTGVVRNAPLMERIRFAAQNHLLVELQYTRLDGQRRNPTIEPYSLRRSQAGDVSLAGCDVAAGHIKNYLVERISGARILERTFIPRFAIELTPQAIVSPRSRSSAGSLIPVRRSVSRRPTVPGRGKRPSGVAGGPTYVVECLHCHKKFRRQSYNTSLNAHKMPSGRDCPGRVGRVVDTKW